MQKIANNCKISDITKYGEKMTKNDKNVKNCQKMPKTAQNRQNNTHLKKKIFSLFFCLKTTPKNGTSHFHTIFGCRDTDFVKILSGFRVKTQKKLF